jgi:molybdopterin synthase sulfur carrier subunit
MTIRILYFAALRESLGTGSEEFSLPDAGTTVAELRSQLLARGGAWQALAEGRSLRVAVNQRMAEPASPVRDGDEIAFFPPVTGG